MLTSHDLQFFAALSGAPSLAAAARALDVTPSAVTQRLKQMEARLGVRLLDRSSRSLALTAEGRLLAQRGNGVLGELEDIVEQLQQRRETVTGHLRVAAPFGFGRAYVAPAMAALRRRHEELELTLMLFEDPATVRDDAWDVLIHVGELADSSLTLHRLAPNRRFVCAAPTYLARHGTPRRPEELGRHVCAVIRENQADVSLWRFSRTGESTVNVRIKPALSSNDGAVVRQWGLAGLGVIVRSEWDVADDIAAGRLVRLLPEWDLPDADVVALLAARSGRVARTTRFLALLGEALQPVPWR